MKGTAQRYEIRIQGHLAPHRLRHFEALTVRQEASGETVILGCFRDQQALYGLLSWLRDLGATLLLVKQVGHDQDAGGCISDSLAQGPVSGPISTPEATNQKP